MIDGIGRGLPPRMAAMGGEISARGPTPFEPALGPRLTSGGPGKLSGVVLDMAASQLVDGARVATLHTAIASGSYKPDPEAIATRMLAFGRRST